MINGITWIYFTGGGVVLERCPKKAKVLGLGEWFVPGGKIEDDEMPESALIREIGEEWPGMKLLSFEPLPIVEGSPIPPGPRGLFLMRPYVVVMSGKLPSHASNGVELRLFSLDAALRSPVPQVRMMVAGGWWNGGLSGIARGGVV